MVRRKNFVRDFVPIFQEMYARFCNEAPEMVNIRYESHSQRGELRPLFERERAKERVVGYTLLGPHRDNLELLMNNHQVRREASQGQTKNFLHCYEVGTVSLSQICGRTPHAHSLAR